MYCNVRVYVHCTSVLLQKTYLTSCALCEQCTYNVLCNGRSVRTLHVSWETVFSPTSTTIWPQLEAKRQNASTSKNSKYNDHLTLKSRQANIRSVVSPPRICLYLKSSASFQCNLNVCVVTAHRLIRQDPDLQRALSDAKRNLLLPVVCLLTAYLSRQFTWSFWSRGGFAPTQAQR